MKRAPVCRSSPARSRGYALLPVAFLLSLLGSIVFLMLHEGTLGGRLLQAEADSDATDYIALAGLQHAELIARQSACSGYALPSTPFAGGTYTATFVPDSGSPVSISVTATGTGAATTTLVRDPVVIHDSGASVAQILAPGSEGKDSFIEGESGHELHVKGDNNHLDVSADQSKPYRALIEFDLSSLPANARIESAQLQLELTVTGSVNLVKIHRITGEWVESEVSWTNRRDSTAWQNTGGDFDAKVEGSIVPGAAGVHAVEVTDLVRDWIAGSVPNYGMILLSDSVASAQHARFNSSDKAGEFPPTLSVVFSCECGFLCTGVDPSKTLVFSATQDGSLAGLDYRSEDLVDYEAGANEASIRLDGGLVSLNRSISALHVLDSGNLVLALDGGGTLGGLTFDGDDLVEYDPLADTATLYFDGDAHFLATDEQITSLQILSNGHLLLSTQDSSNLGGQSVGPVDLVDYDPVSRLGSIYFDGAAAGLSEGISSVHLLENEHLILSFTKSETLGGVTVEPRDLVDYDPVAGTAVIYFPGTQALSPANSEIDAVHVLGDPGPELPDVFGPIAHWRLDETTGTNAVDSEGGHDGAVDGAVWGAGKLDGAAVFDGVDDEIVVPHADALSVPTLFTLMAWVNNQSPSFSGTYRVISKEPTGGNGSYFLAFSGGAIWLGIGGSFFSPPVSVIPNTWYHLAATFDDAADEARIYVDGVEVYSTTTTTTITPNTSPVRIGNNWQGTKYWEGLLDDVRIYDRALAADEIAAVAGGGGSPPGPKAPPPSEGCARYFLDSFDDITFGGQGPDLQWSTDWLEINESNGADSGDIRVVSVDANRYLRVRDNDGGGEGVEREADLSAGLEARLSFVFRRNQLDDSSDFVSVSVSKGPGEEWTVLDQFAGPGTDFENQVADFDISAWMSPHTRIRFLSSKDLGGSDMVYFDEVRIDLTICE